MKSQKIQLWNLLREREKGYKVLYNCDEVLQKFNSANPTVEFDNQKYEEKTITDNRYDNMLMKTK